MDENSTIDLALAYEEDYTINDKVFYEPFRVLRAIGMGRPSWWTGESGKLKVQMLIQAFKLDLTIEEACVYAGITKVQYTYFCKIHPTFVDIKARCKRVLAVNVKQALVTDLQNPVESRLRAWWLERRQSEIYGRGIDMRDQAKEGGEEGIKRNAFMDEKGRIMVSRQTAEIIEKEYGEKLKLEEVEGKPNQVAIIE